jgi:methylenetetrahydrofolate--tRNA-(uracil-5-)-methyltransferase
VVSADSIDYDKVFSQSRYDKGEADYLNCPFEKDEYYRFVEALTAGQKHEAHEFENEYFQNINFKYYENCMPIEELARRGKDTLRFGVMKPVGLEDPVSHRRPYAVIQLRIENLSRTAYNLVGCQTMLKYGEQANIFRLIPGLEHAEFTRFGSIHRNTYLNTPAVANPDFSLKKAPYFHLAGQIAGVEGYMESIFSGLLTALILSGKITSLPEETIVGQLWKYLITPNDNFTPMNANFGLLPEIVLPQKNKKLKKEMLAERSLRSLKLFQV